MDALAVRGHPRRIHEYPGGKLERFGAILRLFALCAATTFGRQVPFSQAVCATWKDNQLHCLCCPTPRYPSEVSACEWTLPLRPHETIGTSALPARAPTFPVFRQTEPYARFQHARCSTGANLSVFQCRPARVVLSRAILS